MVLAPVPIVCHINLCISGII
uniref:Uncharacterized protein n=1 Tax=Arundo donax TaxID=35708 RepID=A0A0A9ENQ3_ARUDO